MPDTLKCYSKLTLFLLLNCMKPLKNTFFRYLNIVILAITAGFIFTGCALINRNSSQRKNIKVEQKARKAEQKAYDARVKAHRDRQADSTKAMMKHTKKKNKKLIKPFRKKVY